MHIVSGLGGFEKAGGARSEPARADDRVQM